MCFPWKNREAPQRTVGHTGEFYHPSWIPVNALITEDFVAAMAMSITLQYIMWDDCRSAVSFIE